MTIGRSSHGTLVEIQLTPGGVFTPIAELGDLTLPELSRNEFDATVQNRKTDDWVLSGIMRRSPLTVPLNFLPSDNTHDHLTGLYKHMIDNTLTGYRVTIPPAGSDTGVVWIMSGQVQTIRPTAPVDGKLSADVTIRFSGLMKMGTITIGV